MRALFGGVYACSTLGQLLREFTSVTRRQFARCPRAPGQPCAGGRSAARASIIGCSSTSIRCCARSTDTPKQGASYGHTKIAGKQILRKGLSPLATTISTAHGAPVVAGIRLRAGQEPARARAPGRMVAEAISTARAAGPAARSWYVAIRPTATAPSCGPAVRAGAQFSLVMTRNPRSTARSPPSRQAWTPVSLSRRGP